MSTLNWARWSSISLFPPPVTSVMLYGIPPLHICGGSGLLFAPLGKVLPWGVVLRQWCPSPPLLARVASWSRIVVN